MDHERLVRLAAGGDVGAFVGLTRRFRHFAFGSALALIHDFQGAEDVVQEAFLAAWIALPSLADPAAFPGWLRGIVRNHAFRLLRGKRLQVLPLSEAAQVADEGATPDDQLERRQQAATVLARDCGIADLAARTGHAVFPARVLASGRRYVPQPASGDREQSIARCPQATQTEDTRYGDANIADTWLAR